MKNLRSLVLASTLAMIASLAWAPGARADIPPTCDEEASLITCAAADVGKPCQGAGQCYAVSCSATTPPTSTTTEYKCDACPTVLTTSTVTCSTTNIGSACGTGATCMVLSAWCVSANASSKYACATPAAAQPTGPPTGETGAGGAGGASTTGTAGAGGTSTTGAAGGGGTSTTGAAGGGGASATGTGGASSSSGGGGCTVGSGTQTTAGIAAGLIVIGLGFLSLSRRRRPR
jgi:hypothetical protein